jgi:hypothetical protein
MAIQQRDALPVSSEGNVESLGTDSGAPVKIGGVFTTSPVAATTGQRRDIEVTTRGSMFVTLKDTGNTTVGVAAAGVTAAIGASTVTLAASAFSYKSDGTAWRADTRPASVSRIVSAAASTNATSAKASAGDLHRIRGYNASAAVRYLKIYNKASAPTVGTDTPVLTYALAPSREFDINVAGFYFSTGIAYALTTGSADADTGALTLADVVGLNITYT